MYGARIFRGSLRLQQKFDSGAVDVPLNRAALSGCEGGGKPRHSKKVRSRFCGDFGVMLNERDADIFQMAWISSSETWPSLIENARSGFSAFGRGEMMKYATSG